MKHVRIDWRKASIPCAVLFMFAISPTTLVAQTWKKSDQVSVRIVGEGSACNDTNDSIGMSSDRSKLLVCQSNVWKLPKAALPSCGQWCPLAGKGPIVCTDYDYYPGGINMAAHTKAQVTAEGVLQTYSTAVYRSQNIGIVATDYFTPTSSTTPISYQYNDPIYDGVDNFEYLGGITFTVTTSGIYKQNGVLCASWP